MIVGRGRFQTVRRCGASHGRAARPASAVLFEMNDGDGDGEAQLGTPPNPHPSTIATAKKVVVCAVGVPLALLAAAGCWVGLSLLDVDGHAGARGNPLNVLVRRRRRRTNETENPRRHTTPGYINHRPSKSPT
jgi:hypothetical protein